MSEQRFILTKDEAARVRLLQRAVTDAQRSAEIAAARARVAVGEAFEAQISGHRALAETHGFDPDQPARLLADDVLVVGEA